MTRLDWSTILYEGAAIVESYSTPVTLRQLHYRLVAANVGGYENTLGCYKQLSARTAELRRQGAFPKLADNGRSVNVPYYFDDAGTALRQIAAGYRVDRTRGQEHQTWLLFEKSTLEAQFEAWTGNYGIPIAALRGYSSESLEAEVFARMEADGRPVAAYYIGDLDPEGVDIERNFQEQATRSCGAEFAVWERLAVTEHQIDELGLVPNPGKETSSRAAGFIAQFGDLFQIETEAVDPDTLERLILDAFCARDVFDDEVYDELIAREEGERERLLSFAAGWDNDDEDDE